MPVKYIHKTQQGAYDLFVETFSGASTWHIDVSTNIVKTLYHINVSTNIVKTSYHINVSTDIVKTSHRSIKDQSTHTPKYKAI